MLATQRLQRVRLVATPIVLSTIGLFILSWIIEPKSVQGTAIDSMLPFAGILAIAAVGQTLVVMTRGIDLSVAGQMTMAALIVSKYSSDHGGNLVAAMLIVIVVAIVIGFANGVAVAILRVSPLVATFAMNTILAGVALSYTGGTPERAPDGLADFALRKTFGVSNSALLALLIVLVAGILGVQTVWGRQLQAVGASERASIASGIPATWIKITSYMAASLCFAGAGIVLAGFIASPTVTSGNRYLLPSIAAVVIGGTSFAGGKGRVIGTAVGAVFLSQLSQLVLSVGLPTSSQLLIEAGVLAVAIGAQTIGSRERKEQLRRGFERAVDVARGNRSVRTADERISPS
ncbi:MAG: ABC transporter permease [Acidimicrobiales bacterium]